MKNLSTYLFLLCTILMFQNCSSQQSQTSTTVQTPVDTKDFVFHAQRANPTNYDAINMVNNLPGGNSMRILDLNGSNYTLSVKENELESVLPYFGRLYNPSYNSDNGYKFTSKDFIVTSSEGKKGKTILKIQPKDLNNVSEIIIEYFKNRKAYLSIKGNDRQPISYDGYMSKNEKNN